MIGMFGGPLTVNELKDWLPFIANIVVAATIYGAMYADVKNVKQGLRDHAERVRQDLREHETQNTADFETLKKSDARQWDRLDQHSERLTKVETVLEVRGNKGAGA